MPRTAVLLLLLLRGHDLVCTTDPLLAADVRWLSPKKIKITAAAEQDHGRDRSASDLTSCLMSFSNPLLSSLSIVYTLVIGSSFVGFTRIVLTADWQTLLVGYSSS